MSISTNYFRRGVYNLFPLRWNKQVASNVQENGVMEDVANVGNV
jgi:hypothetical protein